MNKNILQKLKETSNVDDINTISVGIYVHHLIRSINDEILPLLTTMHERYMETISQESKSKLSDVQDKLGFIDIHNDIFDDYTELIIYVSGIFKMTDEFERVACVKIAMAKCEKLICFIAEKYLEYDKE